MKAFVLTKYGPAATAFELKDQKAKTAGEGNVVIDVEAFGLNYADLMARNGLYKDAPPKPCVIGYEVVGRISGIGNGVEGFSMGQRVAAFTRFGGYAQQVETAADGVVAVGDDMPAGIALALTVQYSTAYFCAYDRVHLFAGDHVLVQAAAGGVGTALVQMAKKEGCTVYGTAGSDEKIKYLRDQGVDVPINYRKEDYHARIKSLRGEEGVDVIFDSLGGKEFKRQVKLLAKGGRIVGFGAASRTGGMANILGDLKTLFGFGFYSPAFLLMQSRGILGVNMLRIADHQPRVLKRCLEGVVAMYERGEIKPVVGAEFRSSELVKAHEYVEQRKSMGKVVVHWD